MRQRVFEGLAWDALYEHFDAISASGYSVSVFTRWGDASTRCGSRGAWTTSRSSGATSCGARAAATLDRHPILGIDPVNCTPQLGVPGPWSDRLPHFRMGFTPSNGEEMQSEYLVPRRHAVAAIRALRGVSGAIRPVLQVSEIRTIAADRLWMSPQYGHDTIGIHFTWKPDQDAVERALVAVEAALAPFDARPHWGKLFLADAAVDRPAVRAPARLRAPGRAARPARRVPQRLARAPPPGPLAHAYRGTRVAAVEHAVEPGSGQPDAVAAIAPGVGRLDRDPAPGDPALHVQARSLARGLDLTREPGDRRHARDHRAADAARLRVGLGRWHAPAAC